MSPHHAVWLHHWFILIYCCICLILSLREACANMSLREACEKLGRVGTRSICLKRLPPKTKVIHHEFLWAQVQCCNARCFQPQPAPARVICQGLRRFQLLHSKTNQSHRSVGTQQGLQPMHGKVSLNFDSLAGSVPWMTIQNLTSLRCNQWR